MLKSVNPANGALLAEFDAWSLEETLAIVDEVAATYEDWAKQTPIEDRCALLGHLANVLRDDQEILAEIITLEMGKRYAEALAEVEKCAALCDYYAQHGPAFLADEPVDTEASRSYVHYLPLGCVLGVMPWNFPFWQVYRFVVPTILSGNLALVKHASNVPQCGLAIEETFRKAGFPDGVMTNLMIGSNLVEAVIRHPAIEAVSLTGSEPAGRKVAAVAGSELKKVVLELGGSDAFVVMADADLPQAVAGAISGRFANVGQSCIAAKRMIVDAAIYDDFLAQFKAAIAQQLVAGEPMDLATTLAPMARQDLLDELHEQVQRALDQGANLVMGGHQLDRPGCYYAPTILTGITPEMDAFYEEFFGPVALVFASADVDEALELANATSFGLAGSVWGRDVTACEQVARALVSGASFVNQTSFSDFRMPFGGVKNSGYGRELACQGIREFTNVKSIWVR